MLSMLVGGSALALMSLNGLLFSLIILAVSRGVSVFARRSHAPMQPEQWVRLYWEDQGFIACDGAGAEQRVDVKALLLSPVVIVLALGSATKWWQPRCFFEQQSTPPLFVAVSFF
jgi:hypothetical protein